MMRWEFATRDSRGGAMTKVMFMNMHAALRGMLDAFVGSWMQRIVAEAEQGRARTPCGR